MDCFRDGPDFVEQMRVVALGRPQDVEAARLDQGQ